MIHPFMGIHRVPGCNCVICNFHADFRNGQLLVQMTFLSAGHFPTNTFQIELAPYLDYLHYEMCTKADIKISSLMYVQLWFPQSLTKFRASSPFQKTGWKEVFLWLIAGGFCSLNKCLDHLGSWFCNYLLVI